jgi:hypothetical protein
MVSDANEWEVRSNEWQVTLTHLPILTRTARYQTALARLVDLPPHADAGGRAVITTCGEDRLRYLSRWMGRGRQ